MIDKCLLLFLLLLLLMSKEHCLWVFLPESILASMIQYTFKSTFGPPFTVALRGDKYANQTYLCSKVNKNFLSVTGDFPSGQLIPSSKSRPFGILGRLVRPCRVTEVRTWFEKQIAFLLCKKTGEKQ